MTDSLDRETRMDMTVISNSQPQRGMKTVSREEQLKPFKDVAEGMETHFASHMIEEMRKSIPRENAPSSAQQYYESLMDYEHAKALAQSDTGLGIKKVILDQILPAHLKAPVKRTDAHAAYQVSPSPDNKATTSKELTNE